MGTAPKCFCIYSSTSYHLAAIITMGVTTHAQIEYDRGKSKAAGEKNITKNTFFPLKNLPFNGPIHVMALNYAAPSSNN